MESISHMVSVPKQRQFEKFFYRDMGDDIPNVTAQRKLNGSRGFEVDGNLYSRGTGVGGDKAHWNHKHPHIHRALADMGLPPGHMLDGEMVYFPDREANVELYPFKKEHYLDTQWIVFDIHYWCGKSLEGIPYIEKIALLRTIFEEHNLDSPIKLIDFIFFNKRLRRKAREGSNKVPRACGGGLIYEPSVEDAFAYSNKHGWEGLVFKHAEALSVLDHDDKRPHRDFGHYKRKPIREVDVLITGWRKGTEGKRNDGVIGSLDASIVRHGKLAYVGQVSGLDDEQRRQFMEKLEKTGPFVVMVKYRRYTTHFMLEGAMYERLSDKSVEEFMAEDTA